MVVTRRCDNSRWPIRSAEKSLLMRASVGCETTRTMHPSNMLQPKKAAGEMNAHQRLELFGVEIEDASHAARMSRVIDQTVDAPVRMHRRFDDRLASRC